MAWNRGKSLLGDAEFDELKARLRQSGSIITAQGPRCSLRSKKMYSDASVDYLKLVAINIPAALLVLGGVFSVDDLTGFEITELIELPEPWGIVMLWGVVLPSVYVLASSITNLVFRDALILKVSWSGGGVQQVSAFVDGFDLVPSTSMVWVGIPPPNHPHFPHCCCRPPAPTAAPRPRPTSGTSSASLATARRTPSSAPSARPT